MGSNINIDYLFEDDTTPVSQDVNVDYLFDEPAVEPASQQEPVIDESLERARLETSLARIQQTQEAAPKGVDVLKLITGATGVGSALTTDPLRLPERATELQQTTQRVSEQTPYELGLTAPQLAAGVASSYFDLIDIPASAVELAGEAYKLHPLATDQARATAQGLTKGATDLYKQQVARAYGTTPQELEQAKERGELQSPAGRLAGDVGLLESAIFGALKTGKAATGIYDLAKRSGVAKDIRPVKTGVSEALNEAIPAVDGTPVPRAVTEEGDINLRAAIEHADRSPQDSETIQTFMKTLGEKDSVSSEFANKLTDLLTYGRGIIDNTFVNLGTGQVKSGNDFIVMADRLVNSHSSSSKLGRDFLERITDSPTQMRRAFAGVKQVPAKISKQKVSAAMEDLFLDNLIEEAGIQGTRASMSGDAFLAPSEAIAEARLPSRVQDGELVKTTVNDAIKRKEQLRREFNFNDPEIKHVRDNTRRMLDEYQQLLIEKGMLSPEEARKNYIPHVMLDDTGLRSGTGTKPGFLKERKGSKRQVTFQDDALGTLKRHLMAVEKLDKNHDFISATVKEFASPYDPSVPIPEGYVKFKVPTPGEVFTDVIPSSQGMIDDMTLMAEEALRDSVNMQTPDITRRARTLEIQGMSPEEALRTATSEDAARTVVMPQPIADFMGTMTQSQERNLLERAFNRFRNMWKSNVTYSGYNLGGPAFQFRNVLTELRNMAEATGAPFESATGSFSPESFKFLKKAANSLFRGKLPEGREGEIVKEYIDKIGGSNLYAEVSGGAGTGQTSEFLQEFGGGSPQIAALFNWDDKVKTFAQNRENLFRLQLYMYDRLEKGLSAGDASRNVDKIFYNYNHLTADEKRVFRDGLVPFYTYFKKDFARAARRWGENPAKAAAYMMIPSIAMNSWNMSINPRQEMDIQESGMYAGRPHIILPFKNPKGENYVMVFDLNTSLEKVLNTQGIQNAVLSNTLNAWRDQTVGDVAAQQAYRTLQTVGQTGSGLAAPELTVPQQIATNVKLWPGGQKPIVDLKRNQGIAQNLVDIGKYVLEAVNPQASRIPKRLASDKETIPVKVLNLLTGAIKQTDRRRMLKLKQKERKELNSLRRLY